MTISFTNTTFLHNKLYFSSYRRCIYGTISKSSTKVSGDLLIEVELWDEFFNNVNSHIFDQEKKFQKSTFVTDFIKTYEEIGWQAFNTNVCMVLNKIIQDVQFALRILVVKKFNILITNNWKISDLFNDKEDLELASKVRQITQQLYNYMNNTYTSDPRIIKKADSSYSFQKSKCDDHDNHNDYNDSSSSHNPSEKSKQSSFKQSFSSFKWSYSKQSCSSIPKKQNDIHKENILINEKDLIDFGISIQTYDENKFREEEAELECLLENHI
ncbi:hypothetical protein C1645_815250 [Glomus cerebriforme]|uniref:Uncharacterized protein n=1 Tax=Glomus cerebriforme TaxID=658196 RepID=A0A397TEA3_9GLOM|nr:hypothetical protein C1645_815250 [Glomus cerebriforme]